MQLLLTGDRLAVFGSRMEGPLLHRCYYVFINTVAQTACHLDICDLASCVNNDIEDNVALGATRKHREIGLRGWKVAGQSYVDVARAQRVCTCGGVGLSGSWGVGVGGGGSLLL